MHSRVLMLQLYTYIYKCVILTYPHMISPLNSEENVENKEIFI